MNILHLLLTSISTLGPSFILLGAIPLLLSFLRPRRLLLGLVGGSGLLSLIAAGIAGMLIFYPQLWAIHAGPQASLIASLFAVPAFLKCLSVIFGMLRSAAIAGVWLIVASILIHGGLPADTLKKESLTRQLSAVTNHLMPTSLKHYFL